MSSDAAIAYLRSAKAVRERCALVYQAGVQGELENFKIVPTRLLDVAGSVARLIVKRFPELEIPYHSRWRHFGVGGVDRLAALRSGAGAVDRDEWARMQFDLVIISVLLDAGAGSSWSFTEGGREYVRSEGLAVASLEMFKRGVFSDDAARPLSVSAVRLKLISEDELREGFQVGPKNELVGLSGRIQLLRRLGHALTDKSEWFGKSGRPGDLFDALKQVAGKGSLRANAVLGALLSALENIWPGRIDLAGVNLGDVWRHPAAATGDETSELVPFHKLSQWLTYSLLEPLQEAGIQIEGLEELTGLAEYRNGGLFVDSGVLEPLHARVLGEAHEVSSPVVVEWRALTVALLDALRPLVAHALSVSIDSFPLPRLLEGGTWAMGRELAFAKRNDGSSPIRVKSDGTVF